MTEQPSPEPNADSASSTPEMDRNKLILRVTIAVVVLFFVGLVGGRVFLTLSDSEISGTQIDLAASAAATEGATSSQTDPATSSQGTPDTSGPGQGSSAVTPGSDDTSTPDRGASADAPVQRGAEDQAGLAATLTPSSTAAQSASDATTSTSPPRPRVTAAASPTTTAAPSPTTPPPTTPAATTPPPTPAPATAPPTTAPATTAPPATPAPTTAPPTTSAPSPTVSIGGGNQLTTGQQFFWPVSSTNAVSGTWSSSCGVANPNWSPGDGWGGSYDTPDTCTLSLTVRNSAGQTATANKNFTIIAAKPTVSIGGGNQLTTGQQFFWPVSSTNAVSGTWSSSCGVANPNWSPGDGWGGSYDTPDTCTLSLTVRNSAGQTATANKNFTIIAG